MKKKNGILLAIILIVFFSINMYMLFHKLGDAYLIETDEAYHATNAYEMYKDSSWMVNTYRHVVEYFNSKPPLVLDLMILSFKAFGVSAFAARFPSAVAGCITCLLVVAYFVYKKKYYAMALFPALLCACSDLFSFHMYRAADFDSAFNMFFVIAMLSLLMMQEHFWFMYVYGAALGLAFMCKGPHAALIFLIGLCYIFRIKDAFGSVKRVLISILLAIIVPLVWMIKRYMFDGMELFKALFAGEVVDRVSTGSKSELMPVVDFAKSNISIIFGVIVLLAIILLIFTKHEKTPKYELVKEIVSDNILFILWTIIPIALFAVTKSYNEWYTYTSQISMCLLTANLVELSVTRIGKEGIVGKLILVLPVMVLSLYFLTPVVLKEINVAGNGGLPLDQFTYDMKGFYEKYGDDLSGTRAYLISDFRNERPEGQWSPEFVAPAEMYCDLRPTDGTVEDFLIDEDAIMIIDKANWDEYAPILSGHVILYDNSYLIMSSDMY